MKSFEDGYSGLAPFDAWIRAAGQKRDDKNSFRPVMGNLHDLCVLNGGIRLQYAPEYLMFEPISHE